MKTRTQNIRRRNARILRLENLARREMMAAHLMAQAEFAAMEESNPEQFAEFQAQQDQFCAIVESSDRQALEQFNEQARQNDEFQNALLQEAELNLEEAMNLMLAGNDPVNPVGNNVLNNVGNNAAPLNAAPLKAAPVGDVELVAPQESELTKAEKKLLKDDRELLDNVNDAEKEAEKEAATANKQAVKAEAKVAELERKLARANNQKKLDGFNSKIQKIKEQIIELKKRLQKVQEDEQRTLEADRTHRVPVGKDEYGNVIYGSADNGHRSKLYAEGLKLKRDIAKLEKDIERLEKKKQPVEKRVTDLKEQKEKAQQAANVAKAKANVTNEKVDDARKAARAKATQDGQAEADAKAASRADKIRKRAERQRKAMQKELDEFNRRTFYITRAIEALQKLGVIPENVKPGEAIEKARADWTKAMESNFAGTMALVGADAMTLAPGGGTMLSVTQALYGILGIRASAITPSNEKAYMDQTTGLVGQWNKLPVLSGGIDEWLQKHHFARDYDQSDLVRIEMERIMNVKTVDIGLK
jgi:DNA repair exonuclease SbcCD ATPase subunit